MSERIRNLIENSVWCEGLEEKHGLHPKEQCECWIKREVGKEYECQGKKDKHKFHEMYRELEKLGKNRKEIMKEIVPVFKDSIWFIYNVKIQK